MIGDILEQIESKGLREEVERRLSSIESIYNHELARLQDENKELKEMNDKFFFLLKEKG